MKTRNRWSTRKTRLTAALTCFAMATCILEEEPTVMEESEATPIDGVDEEDGVAVDQPDDPNALDATPGSALVSSIVNESVMKKIHAASMPVFMKYRRQRYGAPELDWSTDICSVVPDTGVGFDFIEPCIRHDFGYRNCKKFGIFTEANRKVVDLRFLADMNAHCATRGILLRPSCYQMAETYYTGVRVFGS